MLNDDMVINEISRITGVKYSDEQRKILEHRGGMCILASAGSGKALTSDTLIVTPYGFKRMGDIKVGDEVYDECGEVQEVIGVYPQGKKQVYRITFSDDNSIECCSEHIWGVRVNDEDVLKKCKGTEYKGVQSKLSCAESMRCLTTAQLLEHGLSIIKANQTEHKMYSVPTCKPVKFTGEGLNEFELSELMKSITTQFDCKEATLEQLKRCMLSKLYLRVEFLNQLIDKFGSIFSDYYVVHFNNKRVMNAVKQICESLGLIAICLDDNLCVNPSAAYPKLHKYSESLEKHWSEQMIMSWREITNIEKLDNMVDMVCIQVSGEGELYLAENFIPTHNTTVLTHLLAKRIKTGEIPDTSKLLCTTYSKAGSTEMEERLGVLLKKLGISDKVQVKTMHASYFMILKQFGVVTGKVCSSGQRTMMIQQAVREAKLQLDDEDMQLVDSLLSYQINNLMDDEALTKSYVYTLEDVPKEKYAEIRTSYNRKKQEAGMIDFDDMQMLVYYLCVVQKNQAVLDFCHQWEYFFIDEFQDISKIQFEILRSWVQDPNKLIVIGDDDQCIYQWRGANPNIILNICGYYDIQKFVLSTNYRCGGNIVEHASVGIKNNDKRAEKNMVPFNPGGEIKICDAGSYNLYEMSKYAYTYIMELINERRVNPSDIAVLSRNNQHIAILNNMLFKAGVYCVATSEMQLTNTTMYKDIRALIEISSDTYNHNLVGKTLWKLAMFLGVKGAGVFAKFMDETGCSFKDALGYILKRVLWADITFEKHIRVPEKVESKLAYQCSRFQRETVQSLTCLYNIMCDANEKERLSDLLVQYIACTEFMYKSCDRARTINGLVAYISEMIEKDGLSDTIAFLNTTEQYESGKVVIPGDKVIMSTMHGAKGREWPYVILFANDNVTFPSFEGINKMLLDKVSPEDISGSIDENRRLSYVAWTRAKKELVIFTDKEDMSVYTLEALGILNKGEYKNNAHIIRMADVGLPRDIVEKAKEKVFGPDSVYKLEINVSKDNTDQAFITSNDEDSDLDGLDF